MNLKSIVSPAILPFDMAEFRALSFKEQVKKLCQAWAVQGYGSPFLILVYYVLKVVLAVWAWYYFCSFSITLDTSLPIVSWAVSPEALIKALFTAMLYESLGLGCGSGPMTARFMPPITAPLHFMRPGTLRLPTFPQLPLFRGDSRTFFDVLLYMAHIGIIVRALVAPSVTPDLILPTLLLLPLMGLRDKTLFLNARSEHYLLALACFMFPDDSIAGLKWVWFGIWFWAATSKLNQHFPSVISVMISNSAVVRFPWLRKKLFRNYPEDLQPSVFTKFLTHSGTLTEYTFPVLLMLGDGGMLTTIGLITMFLFHTFISSHLPMATPILWNVMMVSGGFFLFGQYAEVSALSIQSPLLIMLLLVCLVGVPILGNFFPKYVSFLLSMRYYAGNWAYSVWLFKDKGETKLDTHLKKCSPTVEKQLKNLYGQDIAEAMSLRVISFRHMHVHGRLLQVLIPKTVSSMKGYTWLDGELVAGLAVGWNFGEGHLHDEQLLDAIQKRCNYGPGELRVLMVESQPLFKPAHAWRIYDANEGLVETGETPLAEVIDLQPWEKYPY